MSETEERIVLAAYDLTFAVKKIRECESERKALKCLEVDGDESACWQMSVCDTPDTPWCESCQTRAEINDRRREWVTAKRNALYRLMRAVNKSHRDEAIACHHG